MQQLINIIFVKRCHFYGGMVSNNTTISALCCINGWDFYFLNDVKLYNNWFIILLYRMAQCYCWKDVTEHNNFWIVLMHKILLYKMAQLCQKCNNCFTDIRYKINCYNAMLCKMAHFYCNGASNRTIGI